MAIKQLRYYDNDLYKSLNQPASITIEQLTAGSLFSKSRQVMIRASEGIRFLINGTEVAIGPAEIYNIPIEENVKINSLYLVADSILDKKDWFIVITFIADEE